MDLSPTSHPTDQTRPQSHSQPHTQPGTQTRSISAFGYTQAKALVFSKPSADPAEVLRLHKYSISPTHGTGVTLRFLASPINPSDINQIQGVYASEPKYTDQLGTGSEKVAVPGNEGVAEVIAVGDAVKKVKKGDWVLLKTPSFGTWRTHASATEDDIIPIPKEWRGDLDPISVGSVNVNPSTAYRLLSDFWPEEVLRSSSVSQQLSFDDLPIKPEHRPGHGEWYIQNAANSAVGRAVIQLGKAWGIHGINVIRARPTKEATDSLRRELQELGADIVVTDEELSNKSHMKEIYDSLKKRPKVAFNSVGGKGVLSLVSALEPGSTVVTFGAMSKAPFPVPAGPLIFKDIRFVGFWMTRWGQTFPQRREVMIKDILKHMQPSGSTAGGAVMAPALTVFPGQTDSGSNSDSKVPSSVEVVNWNWDTPEEDLLKPVSVAMEGFKPGKSVFLFGNM